MLLQGVVAIPPMRIVTAPSQDRFFNAPCNLDSLSVPALAVEKLVQRDAGGGKGALSSNPIGQLAPYWLVLLTCLQQLL